MNLLCSDKELLIIKKTAQAAKELGIKAWVVGGFVRDKLMNRPTKDIDIVCIGDGIALASKTAEKLQPRPMVNFFKTFGTAQFKYFFENRSKYSFIIQISACPKGSRCCIVWFRQNVILYRGYGKLAISKL